MHASRLSALHTGLPALEISVLHVLLNQLFYLLFEGFFAGFAEMQADQEGGASSLHNQHGFLWSGLFGSLCGVLDFCGFILFQFVSPFVSDFLWPCGRIQGV